jgi:hypothetical protein
MVENSHVSPVRKAIIEGLKVSSQKLKASKKQSGNPIVISENKIVRQVEAKDI